MAVTNGSSRKFTTYLQNLAQSQVKEFRMHVAPTIRLNSDAHVKINKIVSVISRAKTTVTGYSLVLVIALAISKNIFMNGNNQARFHTSMSTVTPRLVEARNRTTGNAMEAAIFIA